MNVFMSFIGMGYVVFIANNRTHKNVAYGFPFPLKAVIIKL